jgi:2-amino-4-hydroxy-6-hydroxymethyldihydropteridine diphosphokinase
METVWISLGSNIGDRLALLRSAADALGTLGEVSALSDAFESSPVDFTGQPWFLNAVAGLRVEDSREPLRLLEALLALERGMGRRRELSVPKGPRAIDLDIILYGSRVVESPALRVPHPEMHRRRFVLEPLAQVAPHAMHPVLGRSARELLLALPGDDAVVRRFAPLRV